MAKQSLKIKSISWWHERLCDVLISEPQLTLKEIAERFDVSATWISILKNSDIFIEYWRKRSGEHSREAVNGLATKAAASAEMALDAINKKLENEADTLPIGVLLEIADTTMKRFGYAADKKSPAAPVSLNFNMGLVKPEQLEDARAKMRAITHEALPVKKVVGE